MKIITTGKFTLPVVSIAAFILWWFGGSETANLYHNACGRAELSVSDYGLWACLPVEWLDGPAGLVAGLVFATLAVYLMAELNNANVLLRVSSRMLSSLLAVMLTACVFLHVMQPAHIIMLMAMLSYFTLFATYQNGNPRITFLTYMYVSLASLVFPKLLLVVPFYWLAQAHFRSLSLRCFCASLVGVCLPYWLYAGCAVCMDSLAVFLEHVGGVVRFEWGDYTSVSLQRMCLAGYSLLLFLAGTFDFYLKSYLDKTRTRILYNVVILFGVVGFLFLIWQIDYFDTLFPLALLPTVVVAGHHIVLSDSKFMRIYTAVILVLALALVVLGVS
ncbi:MAG: hypothetical protein NC206_05000 [Bacteroides sp.]|nr:hypothetical protein [Roseburia sp.]MCM1346423.1 hypothetical protein [Bacteroides sp.]MCM1420990.1 hypothetical protein [Bacteroides sp.]